MSDYIVDSYVQMRKQQKEEEADEKFNSYVSARTLLGVLRLSQALARLRMDDVVGQGDVDEALRLMEVSKSTLYEHQMNSHTGEDQTDASKIFRIIKDMATAPRAAKKAGRGRRVSDETSEEEEDLDELSMVDVRSRVLAKGFTETALMETLIEVRLCRAVSVLGLTCSLERFAFAVRKHGRISTSCQRYSLALRRHL